jgi:CheY-like chemotaxis protein
VEALLNALEKTGLFPYALGPGSLVPRSALRKTPMTRPSRIMIVDDNEADRWLFREAFGDVGWPVQLEELASGQGALEVLQRHYQRGSPPDIILLDYLFRTDNCLPILAAIRALPGYELQPIIIFSSAMPPEAMQQACQAHGVLRIWEKPNDYTGIVRLVKTLRNILCVKGDISSGGSWIGEAEAALSGE